MIIILLLLFVDAGLVDEADAMDAVAAQIFAQGVDLLWYNIEHVMIHYKANITHYNII